MKKIHFLGICGTFMASLAILAKELGMQVSGQDVAVYPPMSELLAAHSIDITSGYQAQDIPIDVDIIVVGNALFRGNACVEYVLNKQIYYTSGPAFLEQVLLAQRHVLVVAGTHGKTTTASMLAWLLECGGLQPGFLIGGLARNFSVSARLGASPYFVIEGDEYDTAFFDKQSKFLHYRPRTLIINNIEFDHADIFIDLEAIKRQFQLLLRCLPSQGALIYPCQDQEVADVMGRGIWSKQQAFGVEHGAWQARNIKPDGSCFELWYQDNCYGVVDWPLLGVHNVTNGLAAAAAAFDVGVDGAVLVTGLNSFKGVKRRMDVLADINGIKVYDDFAHHPTAIKTTLKGLQNHVGTSKRVIAMVHCASNTMRHGVQQAELASALALADKVVFWQDPRIDFDMPSFCASHNLVADIYGTIDQLVASWVPRLQAGDQVVLMSNKDFGGLRSQLVAELKQHNNVTS